MASLPHEIVQSDGPRPQRWLVFLHGILGQGRNWRAFARRLLERTPGWGALLVDLRGHGESAGLGPPYTLEACASDVCETAGPLSDWRLVGHSFGGKVALRAAAQRPVGLRDVTVVDSTVGPQTRAEGTASTLIEAIASRPGPFAGRAKAVEALVEDGIPQAVAQWAATNLSRAEDGLRWGIDPAVMRTFLEAYAQANLWPVVEDPPCALRFVAATREPVLEQAAQERLEATGPSISLHRVEGGHWLHVDNPEGLMERLV